MIKQFLKIVLKYIFFKNYFKKHSQNRPKTPNFSMFQLNYKHKVPRKYPD